MSDKHKLLAYFDEVTIYKGWALVNELYPDSEGFNKNGWQWGEVFNDEFIVNEQWLEGLSSNSYAPFEEAYDVFCANVDEKLND